MAKRTEPPTVVVQPPVEPDPGEDPVDEGEDGADDLDFLREIDATAAAPARGFADTFFSAGFRGLNQGASSVRVDSPIATTEVAGAAKWRVDKVDEIAAATNTLGECPLKMSTPAFINRFFSAMPEPGQPPAEFHLLPLDAAGRRVGASGAHSIVRIPAEHVVLMQLRARIAEQRQQQVQQNTSGAGPTVIELLQTQLAQQQEALRRAQENATLAAARADEERRALVDQRTAHASQMAGEVSSVYGDITRVQREAMMTVQTSQADAARAERERLLEERKAEREERRMQHEAEMARVKAEADARLAMAKLEADIKSKEIELRIATAKAEAEARVAEAKLAAEAKAAETKFLIESERNRMADERTQREAREALERTQRETREALERAEREKREDRAERERAAAAAAESERQKAFQLSMEKMRTDALEAAQKRLDADREDQRAAAERENLRAKEHLTLMAGLAERTAALSAGGGGRFGLLGEVLSEFDMKPKDLIEKAKELLHPAEASGGGLGETIAKGIFDLAREVVKRLPEPSDVEEEEEEEEDGEVEELPEEPPAPRVPAKRQKALPENAPAQTIPPLGGKGDRVAALLRKEEPAPAVEATTTALVPNEFKVIDLAAARKLREALEAFAAALDGATDDTWPALVGEHIGSHAELLGTLKTQGLTRAFEGFDIDINKLHAVLTDLGLAEGVSV